MVKGSDLKGFLDQKVDEYNRERFIVDDPISIPHQFTKREDIEITAFFASILAWGQRKTIINKCLDLIRRMDGAPFDFVKNHSDTDLRQLLGFKHRTFNDTDLLYFISFFRFHYERRESLEDAFVPLPRAVFRPEYIEDMTYATAGTTPSSPVCYQSEIALSAGQDDVEHALNVFKAYFFSLPDHPSRTKKHISSPQQQSACKRLNMFLRWMVRKDDRGVDFGLWNKIAPAQLICPCDVHVERVARKLGLILRKQSDWKTASELTNNLRILDPNDPVKYDFALFGLGVEGTL